jgi:hypothetical protein
MKITVDFPLAPQGIYRVRRWGDPLLVRLAGLTTRLMGSNFQPVQLAVFNLQTNMAEFGAVSMFQECDEAFLRRLQYDQSDKSPYGSLTQIYKWLINDDGNAERPYWYKNGRLVFGTIVFGGQLIQVEVGTGGKPVEYVRRGRYKNETDKDIRALTFYKLLGVRKSHIAAWSGKGGRALHEEYPYLIQHATSADMNGNQHDIYNEFPRGTEIFHPVWDARDFPHNLPESRYDTALYIARDFLEI